MPRIDDEPVVTKPPFKKKAYRPWNLLDELDVPQKTEKPIETKTIIVTNQEPISNHLDTNQEPKQDQIGIKPTALVTKIGPESNRISNPISNQISNPIGTIERPVEALFRGVENAQNIIQRVSGLQRRVLFFIVEDCILKGTLYSSPITINTLKTITKTDTDTVKTATQRLINKNLISRGHGKKGKGGFAIFHISEAIRNAVIEAQKKEKNSSELVTNWVSNKEPLSTYSSSSNITTTKSTETEVSETLSNWETINIEPLHAIGFTKAHLRQIIFDDKLSMEMVQDSIDAFAFDLLKNDKSKQLKSTPLNYFMGILRAGKPYAPPANYESPQDSALRLYLDRKREVNAKRQAMEEALFQEAYNEWESKLSKKNKDALLPDAVKNSRLSSDKIAFLRNYYREQLWPDVKNQFLIEAMERCN